MRFLLTRERGDDMRTRKVCEPLGAESQAFMELFYEEHRRFMFYTAWQFARNREDCEDAVQEALERMMKNIASSGRFPVAKSGGISS